jgi:biopolymer transport protein ExbD
MSLSRSRRDEPAPKAEINVVPLVDVALVLVVIFLATATFVHAGALHVDLPGGGSDASPVQSPHPIDIAISRGGTFALNGDAVTDNGLAAALRSDAKAWGTSQPVTLSGDSRAAYGRVVLAMSLAREAGYGRFMIATRSETGGASNVSP